MSPRTLSYLDTHIWNTGDGKSVLEVGSGDVTGNARKWFTSRGYDYTGADIERSGNVDVVVNKSCVWNLGKTFDLIVSLNTLEHVDKPWLLLPTIASHLKPWGRVLLVAPFSFPFHRHPVDCWRYTPDSMQVLASLSRLLVIIAYLDFEATSTLSTLYDMGWFLRRGRIKDAFKKLLQWRTRPPVWNCVALMQLKYK